MRMHDEEFFDVRRIVYFSLHFSRRSDIYTTHEQIRKKTTFAWLICLHTFSTKVKIPQQARSRPYQKVSIRGYLSPKSRWRKQALVHLPLQISLVVRNSFSARCAKKKVKNSVMLLMKTFWHLYTYSSFFNIFLAFLPWSKRSVLVPFK